MWYEFPKLAASFSLWAAIRPTPILLGSCVTFLAPCPLALFQEWCVSDFLFLLFIIKKEQECLVYERVLYTIDVFTLSPQIYFFACLLLKLSVSEIFSFFFRTASIEKIIYPFV